ncbi:MAG TPA: arylamine N-acetyltransferase [Gaiellales bacterium]|nr:arylamine N-acetyltransferase [Gaiellales bacterium]
MRPDLTATYLERLGFEAAPAPTAEALARLHRAHLQRVPFENLDIHLGVPIELDADAFADKVAVKRRGGFCFELNGAFASLLMALGFDVELLEARVYSPRGPGRAFDHLCLAVELAGGTSLADIAFGRGCFDEPIALTPAIEQTDTAGVFELRAAEDGELDLLCNGEPQYRLAPVPRALADFEPGCSYHQSSPDSPFTRAPICTIRTPDGRLTLSGTRLIATTAEGQEERDLDRAAYADALLARFGVALGDAEIDRLVHASAATGETG